MQISNVGKHDLYFLTDAPIKNRFFFFKSQLALVLWWLRLWPKHLHRRNIKLVWILSSHHAIPASPIMLSLHEMSPPSGFINKPVLEWKRQFSELCLRQASDIWALAL